MRPGEYAIIECPASMAYGSEGSSLVPPNTDIITDIYVMDCRNRDKNTIGSYIVQFLKDCITNWYILIPLLIVGGIIFIWGDYYLLT